MPAPFTTPVAKSVPFEPNRNPGFGGGASGLTSEESQSAIEEVVVLLRNNSRFVLNNLHNSTYTNGGFLGLSELHGSVPYVLPKACEMTEMSFSNATAGCSFNLEFYKNGTAAGNLVYTWTLSNIQFGSVTALSMSFAPGDRLYIKYVKTGGNTPSDGGLFMFFRNTG